NNIEIVKLVLNQNISPKENDKTPTGSKRICLKQSVVTKGKTSQFFLGATTISTSITDEISNDANETDEFQVRSSIDLNASDSLGRTCVHHLVRPFPDCTYTSNIELLRLLHSSGASLKKS
ncbi:unnamed protein product, partial [Rotaria magnacalcarata]